MTQQADLSVSFDVSWYDLLNTTLAKTIAMKSRLYPAFHGLCWKGHYDCLCIATSRDPIVASHVWMTAQTHTSSPCVFGVRLSALWVCPAWGTGSRAREQMVVTGREGSRARRQRVQRERRWTCGLGRVETDKILMQGFFLFAGTNTTVPEGKAAPTAQRGKMEVGQLLLLLKCFAQLISKHVDTAWIYFSSPP